ATGIEPVLIGKPSDVLMNVALERLALSAEETWVIGDNPATDIAAGHAAGCPTILVLTGLATQENYAALLQAAGCEAGAVIEDLHTLMAYISDKLES
ncbi:HAD hydrolase-like protein, partial [Paenibacillus sepulcri]|nr:HAD hydrolase-like protein [Paenibacillus sepulcri]